MCPGGTICSRSVPPKDITIFCPIFPLVWHCFFLFFFPWNLHVWKTRFSVWSRCLFLLPPQLTWRLQLVQAADKLWRRLAFLRRQKCLMHEKPQESAQSRSVCVCAYWRGDSDLSAHVSVRICRQKECRSLWGTTVVFSSSVATSLAKTWTQE